MRGVKEIALNKHPNFNVYDLSDALLQMAEDFEYDLEIQDSELPFMYKFKNRETQLIDFSFFYSDNWVRLNWGENMTTGGTTTIHSFILEYKSNENKSLYYIVSKEKKSIFFAFNNQGLKNSTNLNTGFCKAKNLDTNKIDTLVIKNNSTELRFYYPDYSISENYDRYYSPYERDSTYLIKAYGLKYSYVALDLYKQMIGTSNGNQVYEINGKYYFMSYNGIFAMEIE